MVQNMPMWTPFCFFFSKYCTSHNYYDIVISLGCSINHLVPVVQKVDSAIHWIYLYALDSAITLVSPTFIHWIVIYLVDSAIQLLNNWSHISCMGHQNCIQIKLNFECFCALF